MELMSFTEWIEHNKPKKKEKKDEHRSSEISGQVGVTNDQGQDTGHHQTITAQGSSLFPLPQ